LNEKRKFRASRSEWIHGQRIAHRTSEAWNYNPLSASKSEIGHVEGANGLVRENDSAIAKREGILSIDDSQQC
jgi:hypothetical protein